MRNIIWELILHLKPNFGPPVVSMLLLLLVIDVTAQQTDSIRQLNEITIEAYGYNRNLIEVPASVGKVSLQNNIRFNEANLLPVVNAIPGVRMEERSPGSYRLSIRGSTLRSPFGVRNVKVYWNGLPLTDAGGNTYLNQLDPLMIGTAEIIKGPGSSLYGAGTGGVLLLKSAEVESGHRLKGRAQFGSYGSEQFQVGYEGAGEKTSHQVQVLRQQAGGYRDHTSMARDVFNSIFHFENDQQVLETFIFYTDLYYQTPGGLTLQQFTDNPKQARPSSGNIPGAVEQQAAVHLQSFYSGVSHTYNFSKSVFNETGVYANLVRFKNPSIRNYDHRNEQNIGARTVTNFYYPMAKAKLIINGGGEFQWGFLPVKTYENNRGREGALLLDDEATMMNVSVFGQGEVRFNRVSVTGGLSYTHQQLEFHRLSDAGSLSETLRFKAQLMPRLAVLVQVTNNTYWYANVSKGFSPPTLAEINASNGIFNRILQPESGLLIESGLRGEIFNKRLTYDITLYTFALDGAIVIRRETDGSEYFTNAGSTKQNGIEFLLRYSAGKNNTSGQVVIWSSLSVNDYHFKTYQKDQSDFSGNRLTGTPSFVFIGGVDWLYRSIYVRTTCNYTAATPLNDASTAEAEPFVLPGVRIGLERRRYEIYAGAENLLDEKYSLGYDLNAVGGRYYNTAPGRNYYAGVKINFSF